MFSPEIRHMLRFVFIAGLVCAFLLVSVHFIGSRVSAEPLAQPPFQEGYPGTDFPTWTLGPTEAYPGEEFPTAGPTDTTAAGSGGTATNTPAGSTPAAGSTTVSPSASATPGPSLTPTITLTPTATVPNMFLTENAEMGGSSITPPPSQTPEATNAITPTSRATRTRTPIATLISAAAGESGQLDWGLFWIGFAVPVVLACGVVLYLLDRRPEMFSFKRK